MFQSPLFNGPAIPINQKIKSFETVVFKKRNFQSMKFPEISRLHLYSKITPRSTLPAPPPPRPPPT